jgi:hypothetical protein
MSAAVSPDVEVFNKLEVRELIPDEPIVPP